jgi:hypothetical protein
MEMRRSSTVVIVVALLVAGLATACDRTGVRVRGSGVLATETRAVSGFDRIAASGQGAIRVDITGAESLEVEAEDNILPLLTIEVVGGRLELGVEPFANIDPTRPITYRITAAQLRGVSISGSAALEAAPVETDRFEVAISGSGTVRPVGATAELDVAISGSGEFHGEDLQATRGVVDVSGSGQADVNVTDDLTASVSGSGAIRYLGDPTLETSVTGSGSVSRR